MPLPRLHVDIDLAAGAEVVLPVGASRHATRSLRLKEGDAIVVFDGRSDCEYEATIIALGSGRSGRQERGLKARLGSARPVAGESPLRIELGQALGKGERMDFVVQKATELGVHAIHPLLCERSVSRPNAERAKRRIEHWQKVAVHAAEQSGRVRIPTVFALREYEDWVGTKGDRSKGRSRDPSPGGFFLHPEACESLSDIEPPGTGELRPEKALRLLVGPEGGFSSREAERAQAAGYRGLRLGPRVLRTETAALVAIALLQGRWGDLG